MNTILTFKISGKSINELKKQYGTGKGGFYNQSWYSNEDFANSKPEKGEYEINFGEDTRNKTFKEQCEIVMMLSGIENPYSVVHPAVMCEALILHHKETGKWFCTDYWVRTSLLVSDGRRVSVGRCGARGVRVDYWDDDVRRGVVGVGACRKSKKKLEPRNLDPLEFSSLESRVGALEKTVAKLKTIINI